MTLFLKRLAGAISTASLFAAFAAIVLPAAAQADHDVVRHLAVVDAVGAAPVRGVDEPAEGRRRPAGERALSWPRSAGSPSASSTISDWVRRIR